MTDRVTVQSFDWRTLLLVQQLAPSIPTVYLTQQKGFGATIARDKATEWTAGFDLGDYGNSLPRAIKAAGGAIWSPYFGDVDAEAIAEAHRLGTQDRGLDRQQAGRHRADDRHRRRRCDLGSS